MYGRRNLSADWAGGGLVSCSRDLAAFLFALADGRLISAESLSRMQQWRFTGVPDIYYGLGLIRLVLDDGWGELWGHDGYGNSFMYYWPEQDIAVIGTLNQTENDWWLLVEEILVMVIQDNCKHHHEEIPGR
jgi:CubicO group peptidase (beta-lactamase class C family)